MKKDLIVGLSVWISTITIWFFSPFILFFISFIYPFQTPIVLGFIGMLKYLAKYFRFLNPTTMFKYLNIFHKNYFGYKIICLEKVNSNEPCLYPQHPHGIFSLGSIQFYSWLWCHKNKLSSIVASALFWFPGINIFLSIGGAYSAKKSDFKNRLKAINTEKCSLVWIPGGFEDVINMESEHDTISVPYGWIKYVLQEGCNVVPVYHLNEHQTYNIIKLPCIELRRKLSKKYQIPFIVPWFIGKYMTLLPNLDNGIITITGKKITFPRIKNPTKVDITKYHKLYCQELSNNVNIVCKKLYNKNITLKIVELH